MSIPSILSLLLDLAIVGLLVATIVYAARLNRQLTAVKDSRGELESLAKGFGEATAQAEAGVRGLRLGAAESGEQLQALIGKARTLKEELELMLQAGDSLASRLEAVSGRARQAVSGGAPAPANPSRAPSPRPAAASRESDPRMPDVRMSDPRMSESRAPDPRTSAAEPAPRSAGAESRPAAAADPAAPAEPRSRAERELLKALENMRQ